MCGTARSAPCEAANIYTRNTAADSPGMPIQLLDSALTKRPPCRAYANFTVRANAITSRVPRRRPQYLRECVQASIAARKRSCGFAAVSGLVGPIYGLNRLRPELQDNAPEHKVRHRGISIIFLSEQLSYHDLPPWASFISQEAPPPDQL
jgi:N-acetylglutamate synthase/N-acetylornithine aminotransferase